MAIELIVDVPVLKGEKGDKGDTGEFSYGHLEEIVEEHLDDRFEDVEAALDGKVDAVEDNGLVPTAITLKLTGVDELDETVASILTDVLRSDDVDNLEASLQASLQNYIDDIAIELGTGDMLKSVYDTNNDGIVDLAAKADDADTVGGNTVLTDVPADAVFTDTTYSAATTSAAGLMSATDKSKLNGIASGAEVNSITGVKGSAEETYRTGNVNITKANIGLGNVDNKSSATIKAEIDADLFYENGDTFEREYSSAIICPGFVSSSAQNMYFDVHLPKRLDNVGKVIVNTLIGVVRGNKGYVDNLQTGSNLLTNRTIHTAISTENVLRIDLAKGTALANVDNNTPIAVCIEEIDLSFTEETTPG